jgi:uncharacterized protein YdhG (YjbR/CyaY superfamily)
MRCRIAAYGLRGRHVVRFSACKRHCSLHPAGERLVAEPGEELAPYEVSKGAIRFPPSQPPPVKLIERIAKALAGEPHGRSRPRRARGRGR